MFSPILPKHVFKVKGQGLFNIYVEFLIRRSKLKPVILLRESKAAATLMFSVLHTCVMYGFMKKSSKNFWFSSLKMSDRVDCKDKCEMIHGKLSCGKFFKNVRNLNELHLDVFE